MTLILGFIVQCGTCPQRAMVDTQPEQGWVCPRCADAAPPSPYTGPETAHDFGSPHIEAALSFFPQHTKQVGTYAGVPVVTEDDDYPLGKVRG